MRNVGNILLILQLLGASSMNAQSKTFELLDVRTPDECQETRVKGSKNIDFHGSDFKDKVLKLDKSKSYKLYCRSGNRSGKAMDLMISLGFKDVENLGSVEEASKKLNIACEGKPC
jgi:phage shock protein E